MLGAVRDARKGCGVIRLCRGGMCAVRSVGTAWRRALAAVRLRGAALRRDHNVPIATIADAQALESAGREPAAAPCSGGFFIACDPGPPALRRHEKCDRCHEAATCPIRFTVIRPSSGPLASTPAAAMTPPTQSSDGGIRLKSPPHCGCPAVRRGTECESVPYALGNTEPLDVHGKIGRSTCAN